VAGDRLPEDGMGLVPAKLFRSPFFEDIRRFMSRILCRASWSAGRGRRHRALLDPAFDPATEVVLADPAATMGGQASHAVRLVEGRPDHLRLEVDGPTPGLLVAVDSYDPGWKGSVAGRPAPVLRANVGFRAIAVPAGRHVVEMTYRPRSVALGIAVSVGSVIVLLVACRGWRDSA
jgi:hypothetical protein